MPQVNQLDREDRGILLNWTFDQWAICLAKLDPGEISPDHETARTALKRCQGDWRRKYGGDPDPGPFLGQQKVKDFVRAAALFDILGLEMVLEDQREIKGDFEASDRVAFAKDTSRPLIFIP